MPQQPSNFDPITGLWHADPNWHRYQPAVPRPAPMDVPDEQQFDQGFTVTDPPIGRSSLDVNRPPSPAAPQLAMPAPLRVPSDAPWDVPQGGTMVGITPATGAHWTSPEEVAALAATRKTANYGPAMAGLQAANVAGQRPDFTPAVPLRNQAAAEFYARKLGLDPSAANGSISQVDLQNLEEHESQFPHLIEMLKAQSPLAQEQLRAKSALDVEKAKAAAQVAAEQTGFDELQQMMSRGVEPGTTFSTPRGFTVRTAPPSQMVAAGVGGPAQKLLDDLRTKRAALPIGGYGKLQYELLEQSKTGKSLDQYRAELDSQIAALEQELHSSGGSKTLPLTTGPTISGVQPIRKPIPDGSGMAVSTDGGKTWRREISR